MVFLAGQKPTASQMNAETGGSFFAGQKVRPTQVGSGDLFVVGEAVRAQELNERLGGAPPPPPPPGDVPGDVYDLSSWKITLPTGPSNDATEITQPELDSYEDENFFLNASNRMVFRAPVVGSTTSGSGATRCELREMNPGGGSEADWTPTDGQLHQLTVTCRADPTGASPRQEVIVGQIHGAGSSPIPIILSAEFHVSPPRLRVFKDGPGVGNLLTGLTTTTDFTYRIRKTAGNQLQLFAAFGGVSNLPGSPQFTFAGSGFVDREGWYFKHGCYNKSEDGSGVSTVETSFIELT
jgi:hypothetical protein